MRRFGDRKDAYKVRDIHGMQNILIDFAPRRADSEVYANIKIDVTNFCKYIDELKKEYPDMTYFHGMCYILGRAIYSRPLLNRFISNRTMYEHKDVSVGFVAKQKFEEKAVELMAVVPFNKGDNLLDVSLFISSKVKKIRTTESSGDSTDAVADFIGKMPKFLRVPLIGIFKSLDAHGHLPKSLMEGDIYYASGLVTDLGTFKMGAIYHHLIEFGTNSFMVSFGEVREENGKKFMELGATIDERIADGFYFCQVLKLIEYMFRHPEVMMESVDTHIDVPKEER